MSFIGTDNSFYAEITVDGKFNFVDHETGRIIEQSPIQDVYPDFFEHKDIELQKVIDVESAQLSQVKAEL